jgi:hypothetical protein
MNPLVVAVIVIFVLAFLASVFVVSSVARGTDAEREVGIDPESDSWNEQFLGGSNE